jgi:hypothetical protein
MGQVLRRGTALVPFPLRSANMAQISMEDTLPTRLAPLMKFFIVSIPLTT